MPGSLNARELGKQVLGYSARELAWQGVGGWSSDRLRSKRVMELGRQGVGWARNRWRE
jgi:hypothetical protein